MQTLLTTSFEAAAEVIRRGGIVAFPTETVYGLGANVFEESAVARIFEAKRRPADNPLIAHVSDLDQISELTNAITPDAKKLIEAFFPGPLTIVLRKKDRVPLIATAGLDTIGVRMPSFELAHSFLAACETPVVAPSANLSGRPSPTTWQAVAEDLDGRIDCILQGAPTQVGIESTVVDCTGADPVLLRRGSVTLEELRSIAPATRVSTASNSEPARSPGMRHKHYTPQARVVIATYPAARDAAFIGLNAPSQELEYSRICVDVDQYAHALFEFFRECDRRGFETIYCEPVEETGIGAALMDRIRRAAE